jgi:hypothetical protein
MIRLPRPLLTTLAPGLVALAAALAGCSAGDVELNGKIFDVMGVSAATKGPSSEPKLAARAPLVLPPDASKLPPPDATAAPPAPALQADASWPTDADKARVSAAEDLERRQKEYCSGGNWKEKAIGREGEADKGPAGTCGGSIWGWATKAISGKSE